MQLSTRKVTVPIERALNAVPNVIARRSRTIFGLSVMELTFAYGVDDYFARQVVLEKLRDKADRLTSQYSLQNSFAGRLGRVVEPVLKPLGYDWQIGIGIISDRHRTVFRFIR